MAKILVLSDLGRLSDLTAYLSNSSRSSLPSFEASTAKIVGERLGHFFGLLHSRRTYQLVSQHSNIFKKPDPSARDLVYNVTIESIPKYLSKHGISEVETTELHRRIDEDFSRLECEEELGFILGDAWTGTVLIDPSVQGFALSVIDWEFAGFGSGVASDVAQFLAHLQLALLSAEATLSPLASVIQEVMTGFVRTYRRCSDENQMFWTRPMDVPVVTRTIRSAFLLHGREIINNANELQWTCTCCSNKQDDIKEQNREHSCQLKSQMVEAGIWYLRAAGADEQEFAQKIRTGKVSLNDAKALGYLWQ